MWPVSPHPSVSADGWAASGRRSSKRRLALFGNGAATPPTVTVRSASPMVSVRRWPRGSLVAEVLLRRGVAQDHRVGVREGGGGTGAEWEGEDLEEIGVGESDALFEGVLGSPHVGPFPHDAGRPFDLRKFGCHRRSEREGHRSPRHRVLPPALDRLHHHDPVAVRVERIERVVDLQEEVDDDATRERDGQPDDVDGRGDAVPEQVADGGFQVALKHGRSRDVGRCQRYGPLAQRVTSLQNERGGDAFASPPRGAVGKRQGYASAASGWNASRRPKCVPRMSVFATPSRPISSSFFAACAAQGWSGSPDL